MDFLDNFDILQSVYPYFEQKILQELFPQRLQLDTILQLANNVNNIHCDIFLINLINKLRNNAKHLAVNGLTLGILVAALEDCEDEVKHLLEGSGIGPVFVEFQDVEERDQCVQTPIVVYVDLVEGIVMDCCVLENLAMVFTGYLENYVILADS